MKEQFTKSFASLRDTNPVEFWKTVCNEVGQEWRTIYADERATWIAQTQAQNLIYRAWKKNQTPFPLHAKIEVTMQDSALRMDMHHFAFSYDDLVEPNAYAYIAYIPMESGVLYPCLITDDICGNLNFDIFSPHCMADYAERVLGGPFAHKGTGKRRWEEKVFGRHNAIKWADHFFFYNQRTYTDRNEGALSLAEQQKSNKPLVSIWNEGLTYCELYDNHIALHKSFVPYVDKHGKGASLGPDQLQSIMPILEQAWQEEAVSFITI